MLASEVRRIGPGELTGAVAAAVEAVYVASFDPVEQMPFDELCSSVDSGRRRLWVARDGFAVYIPLGGAGDTSLLEYLAVAPGRRSNGVGAALLRAVVADAPGTVVLEIHDPSDPVDPFAERRLLFYQRNGAAVVDCAAGYAMPVLDSAGGLQDMVLMVIPAAEAATLSGAPLKDLVTRIWRVSYGRRTLDPDLLEVLGRLVC